MTSWGEILKNPEKSTPVLMRCVCFGMEMCQQPRIKPNANKTINISLAPPFVCTAHLAFTHSDINGLVSAQRANTKTFSFQREMAAGWFCACVQAAMMDAHGCCCTCLMNPQAATTRYSLCPINLIYSVALKPLENHYDDHTLSGQLGPNQCPFSAQLTI